jgi:hypothetical protein
MEELNKKYDLVYNIFKDFQSQMKEYSGTSWGKLDVPALNKTAADTGKAIKKLGQRVEGIEGISPF